MENFEEELQQFVALEAQLEQLQAMRDKVEKEGMSKAVALEAQQLLPGFNGNRALAFYDKHPSYVAEYRTSLEAMSEGVAIAIIAACAALAMLVARFVDYLFGKKKRSGSDSSGGSGRIVWETKHSYKGRVYNTWGEAMAAKDKDLRDMLNKAFDEVHKSSAFKDHKAKPNQSQQQQNHAKAEPPPPVDAMADLDKLIDAEVKERGENSPLGRILLAEDAMMQDFITNGPYTQTMTHMLGVAPQMRKALTALQGEIAALTRDYPYVMDNPEPEKEIKTELMERLPLAYKTQGKFRDTEWKIGNSVKQIDEAKADAQSKASVQRFKYSEMVHKVAAIVSKLPTQKIIAVYKECEDDLGELEVKLRKLTQGMEKYKDRKDLSDFQQEYQGEAFSALNNLRQDVVGTLRFMNEIDRFGRFVRQIETRIQKMQVEAVKLIAKTAKAHANGLSPEMKKLEKEILEELTVDV